MAQLRIRPGRWALALIFTSLSPPALAEHLPTVHVPAIVSLHKTRITGAPDPNAPLLLDVTLPMRNRTALTALVGALYDPASPQFHHYLTVAQFTAAFSPTKSDYDTAIRFFATRGLAIAATSVNRYMIGVSGRVADVEKVFHLKLNLYKDLTENRSFIAPDREPSVDLAVPLLHVGGLDDLELPAPRLVEAPPSQRPNGTGSGPNGDFLGSDMRAAYYGGSALTGSGQSLALMELAPFNPADVALYFETVNQPLNVPVNGISVDGSPVNCTKCKAVEQALDIEYAISMAPALSQVQVYVGRDPHLVLNAMASETTSLQLSTSWGWKKEFDVDDPLFQEMAVQGQSFLTASGDNSTLKASGPWPEEDANLTAVGGTDIATNGGGGPWLAERGWKYSAGGPSLDKKILIEDYQLPFINAKNAGSTTLRNVPDIAANANTDFYVCAGGKCFGRIGGTSFASPIWTGFLALANQQASTNSQPPVGFFNPTIYGLASNAQIYGQILHDAVGNKSGLYKTVKGFDLVTGLGSPNGQALIDALAGPP
ncbi:MAG: S53 family peptidase [Rhizomicrobium sp.]